MVRIAVVTVSDRVSLGTIEDLSGPLARDLLSAYGEVVHSNVVADGVQNVEDAIILAARAGADFVFTTGGTGVTSRDQTPEGTSGLVRQRLWGLENAIRNVSDKPSASLSRGVAGVASVDGRRVLVLNAPGSPGAVADAVTVVGPLLDHLQSQIDDGDHPYVPDSRLPANFNHEQVTGRIQNRGSEHGDADVVLAAVSGQPIDMVALEGLVESPTAGAVVTFCGRVRNHDLARAVLAIDYEAHPDANAVIERVAAESALGSGACRIAVLHREGHLCVGDIAFAAAVSGSHRKEAFETLEAMVERVKMELPVWKCQHFVDGTKEWTGPA